MARFFSCRKMSSCGHQRWIFPSPGTPPRGGGPAYASLVGYVRLARDQLQGVPIATVSVPKIREDLVDTLVAAVAEAQTPAKQGSAEAGKSVGGMSTKARWFQLLGYLAQVLEGVCRNSPKSTNALCALRK